MLLADGEDEIDAQIDAHIEDRPEALIIIFWIWRLELNSRGQYDTVQYSSTVVSQLPTPSTCHYFPIISPLCFKQATADQG